MSEYQIYFTKNSSKTKKSSPFSLKKIKDAIGNDKKLRFVESFIVSVDDNGKEIILQHAIEYYDSGEWDVLCAIDANTYKIYSFASVWFYEISKRKLQNLAEELDSAIVGENGVLFERDFG